MSTWYNVLAAIKEPKHADLVLNYVLIDPDNPQLGYVRDVLTPDERKAFGKNHGADHWETVNITGNNFKLMSFFVQSPILQEPHPLAGHLAVVEALLAKWPEDSFIIGIWNKDGTQYGQTLVPATYDVDGNELTPETVIGTPMHPLSEHAMKFLPDDVTYDPVTGNETGRARPTVWKDVIHMAGWKPRRI